MLTGNPVRPAIAALRDTPYRAPAADGPFEILVIGGSQGARMLSEVVPAAFAALPETLRRRLRVTQQARAEDLDAVRRAPCRDRRRGRARPLLRRRAGAAGARRIS